MKVQVLYFASLRERLKKSEDHCELTPGETIQELAKRLLHEVCPTDFIEHTLMYGVNDAYVKANYQLQDGDEVSFIPPVAGG